MSAVKHPYPRPAIGSLFFILFVLGANQAHAAAVATTTTLAILNGSVSVTSVPSDTAVTLTATVKAGSVAVPAGLVYFCDAAAAHCTDIHRVGTGQLTTSGSAVFKFIPGPGIHSYKAEFAGTTTDAASSSVASSLSVSGVPAVTTIAQSGSAGDYTLKATVTGSGSAAGPTGKVSFLDTSNQNAVLGTAELGTATKSFAWTTPQSPATAAEPQSIVVADFNSDGIPDLAIATDGTSATKDIGSIQILLGKGDGTFQAAKTFTGLAGDQLLVAAPFVTGGPEDILTVSNTSTGTNNALLLIGDGKGGFTVGTPFSLGGVLDVSALITGDFNGDGRQDFIVGGQIYGVPAFNVYLGNGNGTFNGGTLNATSDVSITALAAGDFTGRGALDIAVVHSDGTVDIFLQDGVGDFFPSNGTRAGSSPSAIAVADFNGDGKADLAITNSAQDNVTILLGDGTGNFTAAASPGTGSSPKSIAVGDFNGDGIPDLAVTNSGSNNVTILLGKGDGTFTAEPALDAGITPGSLATGAFNGDDNSDIAVVNEEPASSAGSATILLAQLTETATASASGIAPTSAGTHLVNASYAGDATYHASVSATTSISGSVKQAVAPILSPAAGTYTVAQKVTLTDATPGATIYYTTNGTAPTTASTKYTTPFALASTETIEAIAAASGYAPSIVASAKYTIETPAAIPTFSTAGGTYTISQSVKITDATPGASIYYTVNGTTPTTASTKYTSAITVAASETIKAIAVATGYSPSAVASAPYIIEKPAATPVFSPVAGTYSAAQSVKITSATTGATIYYTVNGTTPTTASTKYTAAIAVAASETIKAIAIATGSTTSAVASAAYVIEKPAATPVFSPAAGTYTTAQSVKITSATVGSTIYYTTNGATPTTASTKYTTAIPVAASETIKAIAIATGSTTSAVASAAYVIEKPAATPVFSLSAGTYATAQSVKITDATADGTIYYTTNGATPTTASTKYTAAITVAASETIKAIAVATGYTASAIATANYTIASPAAKPAFSVAAGTYSTAQSVQISDATPSATIYYTTNGATPTPASAVYKSAVNITATGYLQAIAVANGFTTSPVASALYSIGTDVTATPVLSPAPGAYSTPQTVTITDATPGAVITYSIGIGSVVNTYTYTGPFTVSSTEYIAFDAIAPGYTRSAALEDIYTIGTVPAPQFSPAAGTYSTAQLVNIYDITPAATIYYTTDGATPTAASAVYSAPVVVTANETIRAFAAAPKLTSSAAVSAAYTIGKVVATPAFSLAPGSYTSAQTVTITDITPGATIYYTLNGTTPTTASTRYTAAIPVSTTETLEAIAVATGDTNSAVATAAYTIGYPISTFVATSSGNNVLTIPVGGSAAFAVAAENQSSTNFASITVKTSTGSNPSLPVQVTLCQTNPSTGQCLAAPGPTVTLSPFGAGANAAFSVFVTATAAIPSSPSNEILVLFTNPSGGIAGSASVLVVTD